MGKEVAKAQGFDYGANYFTENQTIDLRGFAGDVRKAGKAATESLYDVGGALLPARALFGAKGTGKSDDDKWIKTAWRDWLSLECGGMTPHLAEKLMAGTKIMLDHPPAGDQLPPFHVLLETQGSPAAAKAVLANPTMTKAQARQLKKDVTAQKEKGDPLPTPAEAQKKAARTHKAVEASDGKVYLGGTPEQIAARSAKNTLIMDTLRAVVTINEIKVTPEAWVKTSKPFLIGGMDLSVGELDLAIAWLTNLRTALGQDRKIIDGKATTAKAPAKGKGKAAKKKGAA